MILSSAREEKKQEKDNNVETLSRKIGTGDTHNTTTILTIQFRISKKFKHAPGLSTNAIGGHMGKKASNWLVLDGRGVAHSSS